MENESKYLLFGVGNKDDFLYYNTADKGLTSELYIIKQRVINEINTIININDINYKDIFNKYKFNHVNILFYKMTKKLDNELNLVITIPIEHNNVSHPYFSDYDLLKYYPHVNGESSINSNINCHIKKYNITHTTFLINRNLEFINSHISDVINYIDTSVKRTNILIDEYNSSLLEQVESTCSNRINQVNNLLQVYNNINLLEVV